jgi:hypothetical protein
MLTEKIRLRPLKILLLLAVGIKTQSHRYKTAKIKTERQRKGIEETT